MTGEWRKALQIADKHTPDVDRVFTHAVRDLRRTIDPKPLKEALSRGDTLAAINSIPWQHFSQDLQGLKLEYQQIFRDGGAQAAKSVPPMKRKVHKTFYPLDKAYTELDVQYVSDLMDPRAVKWVNEFGAERIRYIDQETRAGVKAILDESLSEGQTVQWQAQQIRELIGLDPRRGKAYYARLKGLQQSGLSTEKIQAQIQAYGRKLLRDRADTISRTETMTALNEARRESWIQARDKGYLPGHWVMEWLTKPDDRLCLICQGMDGDRAELEGQFKDGASLPKHPRCRCVSLLVRVDEATGNLAAYQSPISPAYWDVAQAPS
ncbi:MAG: phage minor head protein [Thermodesulfovibrionales bacterium]|jgi:SPP1 gp7 family putative phage head morphogenesis protein